MANDAGTGKDRPPQEHRCFTVAEANALLPTLRASMERLQALLNEARARYRELEMIKAVGYREDGTLIMLYDYRVAKQEFDRAVEEANRLIDQIHSIGCQIKSIDLGLVDFPAMINGEPVLLCWKLGEDRVAHYHPTDRGYADRRPIGPDDDDTPWPRRAKER